MEHKEGYITDIEYVHGVYRELGPSSLNLVLLVQSLEPVSLREGFTYCDLGCGQGESVNLFAACHPEGVFHGIDFNPAHITGARSLAGEAGLDNVTFWEASFADLDRLPLPQFDFVVMHGIYSWVGAENRTRIRAFLRQKLKPGGVVFLSYNCLPGWSRHAPLRELLSAYAESLSGPLEERVEQALAFVGQLKAAQASVFTASPGTAEFFDYLCTLPRAYVAHEFFNRFWTLFYHADVARDLAQAELSFAGSGALAENQDMLRFTTPQQEILDRVAGVMRETMKDFLGGQLLRRDLFARQAARIGGARQMEHFRSCRFALVLSPERLKRKVLFPIGEVILEQELYDPMIAALEAGPQTLDELMRRRELAALGMARVTEALMVLLSAQYVMPSVEPSEQARRSTRSFNRVLMERRAKAAGEQSLASPVLQSSLKLGWLERMLICCELNGVADPLPAVRAQMEAHGHKLEAEGRTLETEREKLAQLERELEAFRAVRLPMLRQLGIL